MGNTGLPYNPDVPQAVIDKVKDFRASDLKHYPNEHAKRGDGHGWKKSFKRFVFRFSPSIKIYVLAKILLGY